MTEAKDFRVGQTIFVRADQGIRKGTVTKIGRTLVTISHPRNAQGDMKEKAYGMGQIILGQFTRTAGGRETPPLLLFADGWYEPAANFRGIASALNVIPVIDKPKES